MSSQEERDAEIKAVEVMLETRDKQNMEYLLRNAPIDLFDLLAGYGVRAIHALERIADALEKGGE